MRICRCRNIYQNVACLYCIGCLFNSDQNSQFRILASGFFSLAQCAATSTSNYRIDNFTIILRPSLTDQTGILPIAINLLLFFYL